MYFAAALPHVTWQPSDLDENLAGIRLWLNEAQLANVLPPIVIDAKSKWPSKQYDAVFSANTLHIMSWQEVEQLFANLSLVLAPHASVAIYGPFNYDGKFTSASNASFNDWLKARGEHMAIRDFEAVNALAGNIGLQLLADIEMPANNRMLVWRK